LYAQTILRFSEMKAPNQKVYFHYPQNVAFFHQKRKLKSFIEFLFEKEETILKELHCIFCSDAYLIKINKKYLNHDSYTDIITFDLSESNGTVGEIYISIDRLKKNAEKFHCSYSDELFRLVFHGSLHLCGYKDKTKKEKKLMNEKEDIYLNLYSIYNVSTWNN
jgi:probable rRNA maturation factor